MTKDKDIPPVKGPNINTVVLLVLIIISLLFALMFAVGMLYMNDLYSGAIRDCYFIMGYLEASNVTG